MCWEKKKTTKSGLKHFWCIGEQLVIV
jgi:hypothetical protein